MFQTLSDNGSLALVICIYLLAINEDDTSGILQFFVLFPVFLLSSFCKLELECIDLLIGLC